MHLFSRRVTLMALDTALGGVYFCAIHVQLGCIKKPGFQIVAPPSWYLPKFRTPLFCYCGCIGGEESGNNIERTVFSYIIIELSPSKLAVPRMEECSSMVFWDE
ncbi:unnamed protein product [Cylicocyclus nassatus]|uniref:Uncharacterized protein n=1 Tax=Cylicocyclus nassatus TaxID=53992 RepID=A0AA36M5D0_CYLNA|nr:unnamed protein product [Cylicocyclus nassatus]